MDRRKKDAACPSVFEEVIHQSWGFTLIELLIVILILGILAGIGIPAYRGYVERAKIITAIAEIKDISTAIEADKADDDVLPAGLNDVGYQNLLDPWGNPYQFLNIETLKGKGKAKKAPKGIQINTDYDLYSMGRDGKSQTNINANFSRDDIIRGNNGRFIGPVSKY
jgi:general secretion pathway protein G